MGVGLPEDVLAAIGLGIDMFDCVIPTRYARSATVFTRRGRVRLTNRRYRRDGYPIDPTCDCATCAAGFTRAYLHHLFAANEILSAILASVHNVRFYQRLVGDARRAILEGGFAEFREAFLADYRAGRRRAAAERQRTGNARAGVTSVTRRARSEGSIIPAPRRGEVGAAA